MTTERNPITALLNKVENKILNRLLRSVSNIGVLEGWYDGWIAQEHLYDSDDKRDQKGDAFIDYILGRANITASIDDPDLFNAIPTEGSFIIVANHPLGGWDGLILTQQLRKIRPDLKVLTNEMLTLFPEFEDIFIGVDVFNEHRAAYNAKGMRNVAKHLSGGGALLVFPAGTVSAMSLPKFSVSDIAWTPMIVRLAKKYKAPVMPIYVDSKNSSGFYASGLLHHRFRTLLLPRAMASKSNNVIPLKIGAPIHYRDFARFDDDESATDFMRMCCELMDVQKPDVIEDQDSHLVAVQDSLNDDHIAEQIVKLSDYCLHARGDFEIYCAPYDALGDVMEQLSIVRERTFRAAKEGTGQSRDSDRFDPHYMHLFLWDKTAKKIAGGYRLAKTDEVYKNHQLDGLYSHSLFDYDAQFLKNMGQTIEVGRSFVALEYQRNPRALDMLWKGIGRFVAANTDYHTLFGCVSISREYSALAKAILTETFLENYGVDPNIKKRVKARTPIEKIKRPWSAKHIARLCDMPILNTLVGRIDGGKTIPVLIRHYLALNGRFISFTVNTGFNAALDGLIMVDLRTTEYKYLKRYMGEEAAKDFLQRYSIDHDQKLAAE